MKFKQQQKIKRNKGSILIGVILLFIMIVSISAAVVSRSFHGSILAIDSKKGYSAYQASDTNAEKILNDVKSLDSKDGTIPENTDYLSYCGDKCYKQDGSTTLASGDKVSDIYFIEKKGDAQSATRAVKVSMLDRVENPVSDLKVASDSKNGCDAKFSLTYIASPSIGKISNLELRKSITSSSLTDSNNSWSKLNSPNSSAIGNGDLSTTIKNSEFDYNKTYYFSLKAKNKNPLALDSLYYKNVVKFDSPSMDCEKDPDDSDVLGCLSSAKGAHNPDSYACCGGTECYVCESDWSKDSDASGLLCCTQNAPSDTSCGCSMTAYTYKKNTCEAYTATSRECPDCPPPSPPSATTTLKK
ncbi:MAG: hypothetical protein WCK16_04770 [Candidatus Moraniibacteriota bacterium]